MTVSLRLWLLQPERLASTAVTEANQTTGPNQGTERLLHRLDLVELTSDDRSVTWRGTAGENAMNMSGALFGGFVLAQCAVAAGRTLPDMRVHSLQQVFLRGGKPTGEIDYRCEVLFEGRTYASARVEVVQNGDVISHAQVGFTNGVDGPEHETPTSARSRFEDTVNRDELRGRPTGKTSRSRSASLPDTKMTNCPRWTPGSSRTPNCPMTRSCTKRSSRLSATGRL